jgi:hypothetical protein
MSNDSKRTRLINFKVSLAEYDQIESLAREKAGGNISVWLRRRGMTVSSFPSNFVLVDDDEDNQSDDDSDVHSNP